MIVCLTGGIGSGKTMVSKIFELMGCPVFNSDIAAKQAYLLPQVREQIILLLGGQAYKNAELNKAFIAGKIFADPDLLKSINSILHPEVISAFKQFVAMHPGQIVIKESALLFEAKLEKECSFVIVVTAPEATRIGRVMQRDKITREEVLERIKHQVPQEEKEKKADFVISNNGEELLIPQVIGVLEHLKNKKYDQT
jgi:dephospho-CoA kinase